MARFATGTEHVDETLRALGAFRRQVHQVDMWGVRLASILGKGGRLLVAGNGGSAAEAQHLTAELVGRYQDERRPLSAIALHADTSSLTAITNDYGPDEAFRRQVLAHGRPGDVFLGISTSGRSPNILAAAEAARSSGLVVWALTGPRRNPLDLVADDAVCIEAPTTAAVQEVHLVALHALCAAVDAALAAGARGTAASASAAAGTSDPSTSSDRTSTKAGTP